MRRRRHWLEIRRQRSSRRTDRWMQQVGDHSPCEGDWASLCWQPHRTDLMAVQGVLPVTMAVPCMAVVFAAAQRPDAGLISEDYLLPLTAPISR